MIYARLLFASLLTGCIFLQGCGSVKKSLGIDKDAPDEFAVNPSMQPLDMPPDFFALPKPQPGMPRPQDAQALQAKKEKLIGISNEAPPTTSGQQSLLEKAGASEKQADIRQKIDAESKIESAKGKPVLERLGIKKANAKENVINPYDEQLELDKKGIATQKPVNQ